MSHFYPSLPYGPFRMYVNRWVQHNAADGLQYANVNEVAAAVGCSIFQLRRAVSTDRVPFHSADQWACRLGVHPSVIWGEDYWHVSASIDAHADEMLQRKKRRNADFYQRKVAV